MNELEPYLNEEQIQELINLAETQQQELEEKEQEIQQLKLALQSKEQSVLSLSEKLEKLSTSDLEIQKAQNLIKDAEEMSLNFKKLGIELVKGPYIHENAFLEKFSDLAKCYASNYHRGEMLSFFQSLKTDIEAVANEKWTVFNYKKQKAKLETLSKKTPPAFTKTVSDNMTSKIQWAYEYVIKQSENNLRGTFERYGMELGKTWPYIYDFHLERHKMLGSFDEFLDSKISEAEASKKKR